MKFIFSKKIKARDPVTGKFEGINAFAAESTEEYLERIQQKGEETLADVEAQIVKKGAETLKTIPDDYTELYNQVQVATDELSHVNDMFKSSLFTDVNITPEYMAKKYIGSTGNFSQQYYESYRAYKVNVDGLKGITIQAVNGLSDSPLIAFYSVPYSEMVESVVREENCVGVGDIKTAGDTTIYTEYYDIPVGALSAVVVCNKDNAPPVVVGHSLVDVDSHIKNADEKLNAYDSIIYYKGQPDGIEWETGIIASTGAGQSGTKTGIRTKIPYLVEKNCTIKAIGDAQYRVFRYATVEDGYKSTNLISATLFMKDTHVLNAGDIIAIVIKDDDLSIQTDTHLSKQIEWDNVKSDIRKELDKLCITSPFKHGDYDISKQFLSERYIGLNEDYNAYVCNSSTKYSEIISLYDDLVSLAPEYVTKVNLGLASGTDENGQPYYLYEYIFKPKRKTFENNKRIPVKVCMDAGMHGFEKNAVIGAYLFLEDIVKRWSNNTSLTTLRNHVEFHMIPVSNPWGFDNNKYVNGNGVNINRNFPDENWVSILPEQDSTQASGAEASDQPETQIIVDYIERNKDMMFYVNHHTNGQTYIGGYGSMNALLFSSLLKDEYFNRQFSVLTKTFTDNTSLLPLEYPSMNPSADEFIGSHIGTPKRPGMFSNYCDTWRGDLMGFTLETFNGLKIGDDIIIENRGADSRKMCSEMIGNYIINMIHEFAEH